MTNDNDGKNIKSKSPGITLKDFEERWANIFKQQYEKRKEAVLNDPRANKKIISNESKE